MSFPPMEDQDGALIARQRLIILIGEFEDSLSKIQGIFKAHVPIERVLRENIENQFWHLRHAADEIGDRAVSVIENLIRDYEHFSHDPTEKDLATLFQEIAEFKELLHV